MSPCTDCDPAVPGIRGMCLEHRAQIAEQLLADMAKARSVLLEITAFPQREKGRRWHAENHQGPEDCQGCRIEEVLAALSRYP